MKKLMGIVALLLGSAIVLWIGYNLLVSQQPQFRGGVGLIIPVGFVAALFFVGLKWLKE